MHIIQSYVGQTLRENGLISLNHHKNPFLKITERQLHKKIQVDGWSAIIYLSYKGGKGINQTVIHQDYAIVNMTWNNTLHVWLVKDKIRKNIPLNKLIKDTGNVSVHLMACLVKGHSSDKMS